METSSKPRLQEKFRAVMRLHHYSIRTEKSYWYWIRYFIRFHKLRHPLELGATEVNAFLTWLAVERQVAAATQNLALNSLVFLYDKVLQQPLGQVGEVVRAKRSARIPCVLTHEEATALIARLGQPHQLLASLMYGAGLRVVEAARLRIKDVDFDKQIITIHDGKGAKDRTTLLPAPLITQLLERRERMFRAWKQRDSFITLPSACHLRYVANTPRRDVHSSGSGCSRRPDFARMRTGRSFVITFMSVPFRKLSDMPCGNPICTSLPVAIPFATVSPPSYCVEGVIFALCRRYWGMRIYVRRRSIRMCWDRALPV